MTFLKKSVDALHNKLQREQAEHEQTRMNVMRTNQILVEDIRKMKKRSFIMNDLLKGCMQRLDYNVLVPYLMPKQEYVITIQLTDLQKKLYRYKITGI